MKYRPGVCIITYRMHNKNKEFLLLHRTKNWRGWEIPKGGMQPHEDEDHVAARELQEETGCDGKIKKLDYTLQYDWPKDYIKDDMEFEGARLRLYSAEIKCGSITVDETEHDGYKWAGAEEALEMITYEDQREALRFYLNTK